MARRFALLAVSLFILSASVGGAVAEGLPMPVTVVAGVPALLVLFWGLERLRRREVQALADALNALRADGRIILSRTTRDDAPSSLAPIATAVDRATYELNSIMLEILIASRKFSLFSADIYYSGQHLSEVSDEQANQMAAVSRRAREFHDQLAALVHRVTESRDAMTETATRYGELRNQTEDAHGQLSPLAEATAEARERAEAGLADMERSQAATAELAPAIERLNHRIDEMLDRNSRIGTVLAGVQDIAEKTHVLATNASIEAARAGSAGRGFAVIAAEVRTLSQNSRQAIDEVAAFLQRTAEDIRASAAVSREAAEQVRELEGLSRDTESSLHRIVERVETVSHNMEEFRALFDRQRDVIGETIADSERIHGLVDNIGQEITANAGGYEELESQVRAAADGAAGAAHSARVLSQLGTYLRTGGHELSHVVETVDASEPRYLAGVQRKEPRTILLYNLEVLRDGEIIGHLGDISPSGLMLYATTDLPIGEPVDAAIHLPLTYEQKPDVPLRFVPRRSEKQSWFYRIGCSIDASSSRRQREDIEMIISTYTVAQSAAEEFSELADAGPTGDADETDDVAMLEEVDESDAE